MSLGALELSVLQQNWNYNLNFLGLFQYFCNSKNFGNRRMKILVFILSFIMLGLSCLPCSDKNAFLASSQTSVENTISTNQHHQNDHQDLCNPFCSCSCCGVTQVNPKVSSFEFEIVKPASSYTDSYLSASTITIALPIWQPPQLKA